MDPLPPPTLDDARRQVRIRHLEQLVHANITLTPPEEDDDTLILPSCKIFRKELKTWSQDHNKSIKEAIQKNVLSGKENIDWNCCFLAFMESITVYLRDWDKLHDAVQLYKSIKAGTSPNGDLHQVHDLYEQSVEGIKEVGTDPKNIKDINVDSSFDPIQVDAKHLFGTVVSEGVYYALFGTFNKKDELSPFELILKALEDFVPKLHVEDNTEAAEPLLHVTGHSLGGSYSSFCFAQFMMQNASLPAGARLGDLYNFGSPRVGQKAWSQAFYENLGGKFPGGAWRIVNDEDIVPKVPSLLKYKPKTGPFYHIDNGIKIFKEAKPAPIETERTGAGNVDIGLTRIGFVRKLATEKYHCEF
ncbi:hypothetical protein H9Q70_008675 [Fusarium xylarioides]|nr:hypothetical protein H9Q70_008675 [Fusarium xylarioides]